MSSEPALIEQFAQKLSDKIPQELDLIINENHTTMLNVLERRDNYVRLSVHRIFLNAPDSIIRAIAYMAQGTCRKQHHQHIRRYINENHGQMNYSAYLNKSSLLEQGDTHHLGELYAQVNEQYFDSQLQISISWFGRKGKKTRSRIIFGEYCSSRQFIKIHRRLDDPFVPEFFVSSIIYHEMLHHVIPGYHDATGRFRIHHPAFKAKERVFEHFAKAKAWEKAHRSFFFSN